MKVINKISLVTALLAIACLAVAQGRMRMMGGANKTQLLQREDVQKELKLTSEQKTKLDDQRQAMMEEMRGKFQPGGSNEDREAMMKEVQKMMEKAEKDANAILTADQQKRLKELWIQREGNRVLSNEDIQKELALTQEQKDNVKKLNDKQREAMQSLFEKMRNQEIDREEMQASMKKNNDKLSEELGKLLTADQATKLKGMRGADFKFDEDEGGR